MFGIAPSELLIVAVAALVLIGPKDIPRVLRVAGQWIGRGRAMSRHLRGTVDALMREADLLDTGPAPAAKAPAPAPMAGDIADIPHT